MKFFNFKLRSFIAVLLALVFLGFMVFTAGAAAGESDEGPFGIVLTWQNSPQETMSMTWWTEEEEDSFIYYTSDDGAERDEFEMTQANTWTAEEAEDWIHGGEITGLEPDTEYRAFVTTGDEYSEKFTFQTAPEDSREINFIAGGDSRTNIEDRREINRRAAELEPEFVLFAGDLVESPNITEEKWQSWVRDWSQLMVTEEGRRIPVIPAVGNHEIDGASYHASREEVPFYFDSFLLPGNEKYFTLDYGPDLTLLTLDSDHTSEVYDSPQYDWLNKTLPAIESDWIVTQYHVPGWTSQRPVYYDTARRIRDHWVPLFEEHGVDMVNEAHDHTYKVTERIDGVSEFRADMAGWIEEGMERAEEDYDPEEDYTPWSFPELSELSGGSWDEVEGIDNRLEAIAALPYYTSLYLMQEEGELTFEMVFEEVADTTLHNEMWDNLPEYYDIKDEEGILYVGDGAWGAPLRTADEPDERWYLQDSATQYNFYEMNLNPEEQRLEVVPHVWEDKEEWIEMDSFTVEQ